MPFFNKLSRNIDNITKSSKQVVHCYLIVDAGSILVLEESVWGNPSGENAVACLRFATEEDTDPTPNPSP